VQKFLRLSTVLGTVSRSGFFNVSYRYVISRQAVFFSRQSSCELVSTISDYPRRLSMSVGVPRGIGFSSPSVCLFVCVCVCLFVCPQHNSKTNDPKVYKLGIGYDLGMSYT